MASGKDLYGFSHGKCGRLSPRRATPRLGFYRRSVPSRSLASAAARTSAASRTVSTPTTPRRWSWRSTRRSGTSRSPSRTCQRLDRSLDSRSEKRVASAGLHSVHQTRQRLRGDGLSCSREPAKRLTPCYTSYIVRHTDMFPVLRLPSW